MPGVGGVLTQNQIIVTVLFGSASRAPEDTASFHSASRNPFPVLYRWRRQHPTTRTTHPTAHKHCCMVQTPINMDIENDLGLIKCQGKTTYCILRFLLLVTHCVRLTGTPIPHTKSEPSCSFSIPIPRPTDISSSLAEGHLYSQIQLLVN